MRAPWGWYRAFGRIEAATWDRPKIEIDLEVTFRLCNKMTVSQRLEPVAGGGCTPADWHQAVDVQSDKQRPEWRLCEVLRSYGFRDPVGAAPPIVSPSSGLLVRP